jgi:hypothetical protein
VQDGQARIVYANPKAGALLGVTIETLAERTTHDARWDAVFQDGTPLTADDVVYTYEVWLRPSFALADAATTRSLTTARVVDPRTVDFALASVEAQQAISAWQDQIDAAWAKLR